MQNFRAIIGDTHATNGERLSALSRFAATAGSFPKTGQINNHIHTIYSFSPYTPSMAALRAAEAGLEAAGSVDHDSIAAAEEMIAACAILGIGGCSGFEVRVSMKTGADGKKSAFADRKINNPDSVGVAYMTVQGIPRSAIPQAKAFLKPIQDRRLARTKKMTDAANGILLAAGFEAIDFQADVAEKSMFAEGGEITERHLLAAVAEKIIQIYGKTPALAANLKTGLGIEVSPKIAALLADAENPHYLYDLLGVLKSSFLPRVFIQPDDAECISAARVVNFADSIGAIPAYAYLGDVGESPTGDKKAEKFEDDYLDELFAELSRIGYKAIAYMPPRNTLAQLLRVQKLCAEYSFMEISGVDINSSRQSFNCPEVLKPEFRHLVDTTWALITHEQLASVDPKFALFSSENPLASMPLQQRLTRYAEAGRALDLRHPEETANAIAHKLPH